MDEEFLDLRFGNKDGNLYKCLYPTDLHYLGSNPDEYKLEVFGRQVYQLKTILMKMIILNKLILLMY